MNTLMRKSALMSKDGLHRYTLERTWDDVKPKLLVIGLNPSTADHEQDDPTVRREIAFAMKWGYGGLLKGNAFSYRATDPANMFDAAHHGIAVNGEGNDLWLLSMAARAKEILVAWGIHGAYLGRDKQVVRIMACRPLLCLGTTKAGHPKHPLYVRGDTIPRLWVCP